MRDVYSLESSPSVENGLCVGNRRVLVGAHGNIKPSSPIHSIKAVKTGFVEVDKPRGLSNFVHGDIVADFIVPIPGMTDFVGLQVQQKLVSTVPHSAPNIDQLRVYVAETCLLGLEAEETAPPPRNGS